MATDVSHLGLVFLHTLLLSLRELQEERRLRYLSGWEKADNRDDQKFGFKGTK